MPSISQITKQYAKHQSAQKGGGVFDFLGIGKSEPEKNPNSRPEQIESSTEIDSSVDVNNKEPSMIDKALNVVGLGKTAPESAPTPESAPAPAPAPESAPAPEDESGPSMMDKLKGALGMNDSSSGSKNNANETQEASSASEGDSDSDSDSDSDNDNDSDNEDEENGLDFDKFAEEIQTLRKKYEDLKRENKKLKNKKKEDKSFAKDTSEMSKMIAAFFAIKGSVAQLQIALKKHADQNGFPVDGLGLDDVEEKTSEPFEAPISESSDSESDSEPSVEETPTPPEEAPSEEAPPQEAQAQTPAPAIPSIPNEQDKSNSLFSGGKNHFIQTMKKNKTHRHHKRRNRHQTLRK